MTIYIVEEWRASSGADEYVQSFCFDAEHEAKAFMARVTKDAGYRASWYLEVRPVFTHVSDALAQWEKFHG